MSSAAADNQPTGAQPEPKTELPPLSEHDFRIYNRMAVRMDAFHQHFRMTWNLLWDAASAGRRPPRMSLRQFINEGLQFAEHLTAHHGIEEAHIFPRLAARMPEFRAGAGGRGGDMVRQHEVIHRGLDGFEDYLRGCLAGRSDFELAALKARMESWGAVLWTHLDAEVEALGAQNMRRYWSKEEMQRMPM